MEKHTDAQTIAERNDESEQWQHGQHWMQLKNPELVTEYPTYEDFWGEPPEPNDPTLRPEYEEEPTWYQVYETVTEGTPVTPPFATEQELADYLVRHNYGTQKQIDAFVRNGWTLAFAFIGGKTVVTFEIPAEQERQQLGRQAGE